MLETFRKHHYVLMCFIAAAVIIAFTFLSDPNKNGGGPAGSSQRVGTLYGKDFTVGEVQNIMQEQRIAMQLASMAQDREGRDPVMQFGQTMSQIVDTMRPRDNRDMDVDYPTNIKVLRTECEKLGIEVERADMEKFITGLGAFQTNGAFDAKKLETFLTAGPNGDRAATETKLFATVRDVMLFQRLAQLVGGSFGPSKAEINAGYALSNQKTTAVAVLIEKKAHEAQTVTDEEVQKFYDGEKAKKEAPKADDKTPAAAVDPMVLSEEKRTVKYVFTEAPVAPVAPLPPASVPPLEDVSKLPEDQKKAREEEHKKKMDEYTKATEEHGKLMTAHAAKVTEHEAAKKAWLASVGNLSNALVAEERGGKTFDQIAAEFKFEIKTATFPKSAVPEDLKKIKPRAAQGRAAVDAGDAIFAVTVNGPEELLEDSAQGSFAFFTVTGVETSAVLPLDQVKAKIQEKLKTEKVTAAVKAAADSARSNLLEAVKGGKSFKDAATEAKLTLLEPVAFTRSKPPGAEIANGGILASQAADLNAGEISEAVEVPEGLMLVSVVKKELPKAPDMEQSKQALTQSHTFRNAMAVIPQPDWQRPGAMEEYMSNQQYFGAFGGLTNPVFKAWFTARRSDAQTVAQ